MLVLMERKRKTFSFICDGQYFHLQSILITVREGEGWLPEKPSCSPPQRRIHALPKSFKNNKIKAFLQRQTVCNISNETFSFCCNISNETFSSSLLCQLVVGGPYKLVFSSQDVQSAGHGLV